MATETRINVLKGTWPELEDTQKFLNLLVQLSSHKDAHGRSEEAAAASSLMRWNEPLAVGRAPGRLDVMGGIADYSGSLVLQLPIKEACHVALQLSVPSAPGTDGHIKVVSMNAQHSQRDHTVALPLSALFRRTQGTPLAAGPEEYTEARAVFESQLGPNQRWAAYVIGTLVVLAREVGEEFWAAWGAAAAAANRRSGQRISVEGGCEGTPVGGETGAGAGVGAGGGVDGPVAAVAAGAAGQWGLDVSILVVSDVPEGKGVASSAAVEVATICAFLTALQIPRDGTQIAILCQMVENRLVGAPCGIMDQMASTLGQQGKLLALLCQPAQVKGYVPIPCGVSLWGVDSGVRHSLAAGASDYASVRAAAFMGRTLIQDALNKSGSREQVEYLCSLRPHRFDAQFRDVLPETLLGSAFLEEHGSHGDPVTAVKPNVAYPVRAATAHPVGENFRVLSFGVALAAAALPQPGNEEGARGGLSDEQLLTLGELMMQCHSSYSSCGLGSEATDLLVRLAQAKMSPSLCPSGLQMMERVQVGECAPLYGAKITGGGSGGTVCVMGAAGPASDQALKEVCDKYEATTGRQPFVFSGSSPGAIEFGELVIQINQI